MAAPRDAAHAADTPETVGYVTVEVALLRFFNLHIATIRDYA